MILKMDPPKNISLWFNLVSGFEKKISHVFFPIKISPIYINSTFFCINQLNKNLHITTKKIC